MTKVYLHRSTPNLTNGQDVKFKIGEIVTYGEKNWRMKIDSEIMSHEGGSGDKTGYEAIDIETNERVFISRYKITNWEGKSII